MLCYILAQYAPQVHENILLFFRHKKQSHRNCCRILNINLVIGICKFISSKLWMLPTPTRHLQLQYEQIADASEPDQASSNPIPASCRCFLPRPGICKSNSNKLQMLPTPARHLQIQFQQVADDSDPRICICKFISSKLQMLPTLARHLQIQFQQVADASDPDQASANPIPASCRCFRP